MPSPYVGNTVSLGQLLANPYAIQVPPYQRSFAWTEEEAGRLLDDLVGAFEADSESGDYFLGTILFTEAEVSALRNAARPILRTRRVRDVVDGLQRLTTLTIMFSILRDLDEQDGERPNERLLAAIAAGPGSSGRPRLELRGTDETFFQHYVRRQGATDAEPDEDKLTQAEARIVKVRNHLMATLADFGAAQRRRLGEFLLDNCHVVQVVTTGIDRAHRLFAVLNATGKPLGRNDILKAELLGSVPVAGRERATAAWDAAAERLDRDFESLFSHVRTAFGKSSQAQVISEVTSIAVQQGGSDVFIERTLQPTAAVLDDIRNARHSGSPHSPAIVASLRYLGWLRGGDWIPPALLWWMDRGRDAAELAWFLGALDRLAYGLRIMGLGNKRRATRLGSVVHAIRHGLDLKVAGSPIHLSRDELKAIHYNLRDLHARSAPMAKLVLMRLNDQIAGSAQSLTIEDYSVEHLLPRKPGANSQWRGWFPDPAERGQHTESLGNLILVTKAQNDRAGNSDFARKQEILFRTPNAPLLPLNESVRRQTEWKAAQIKARESDLMERLNRLWGLGVPQVTAEGLAGLTAPARRRKAAAG